MTVVPDGRGTVDEPGMLRRRSVTVAGHRTSISLENAFWWELREIARFKKQSLNQLISEIVSRRSGNLSSALRVYVLRESLGTDSTH